MITPDNCNQVVVAFCAPNPSCIHFMGVMVGYHNHPTAIIVRDKAEHASAWAAHLCRPATASEAEAFWKERALKAESELAAVVAAAGEVA